MTIDHDATLPDVAEHRDELVQFVYRATGAPGLLAHARALLDKAPRELAESFEQAVRTAGFAS
ncbi:MAG: hypothetical protein H7276_01160 [Caulobacter sp.]|nr:hypothetical protein [Vitreoscilla sp.]